MKVKELIELLQTLDPEKGIWVCYDSFVWFPPVPDDVCEDNTWNGADKAGVENGDYIIIAG